MPLKIDAAYHRAWYAKNRESVRVRKLAAYYADIEKSRASVRAASKRNYVKNKEKLLSKNKAWVEANRAKVSAYNSKYTKRHSIPKKYGIDFLTYSALLISQCGKCACCDMPFQNRKHTVHIDHDHSDNKVRGLLCGSCNLALGCVKDSIPTLVKCIDYLKRFNVR